MSAPLTPLDLVDAVATLIEATATAGRVIRDPMYYEDEARYPKMVEDSSGHVDGWLVGIKAEEPEQERGTDGAEQYTRLFVVGMLSVATDSTGTPSRAAFGNKVRDAKDALRASRDLGLESGTLRVRHEGLYAPNGYPPRVFDETMIHSAPMELRVFVGFC